jgi:hypothetical protein
MVGKDWQKRDIFAHGAGFVNRQNYIKGEKTSAPRDS